MLTLDAGTLGAEDGEVNPATALLRLQRCRRPAELAGIGGGVVRRVRRDGRSELAERLSDALLRMLARFGGNETGAMTLATLLAPNVPHPSMSDGAAPLRRGAARRASIRAAS